MAYEINININGDVEDNAKIPKHQAGVSKPTEHDKNVKALVGYVSAQTIQPFLQNVKTAISQDIGTITGNSELQQRVNFGFEAVQYGVGAFKNAQAGMAIAGALGKSMTGGAVVGLVLTAVETAINIGFNQHQINLKQRMDNFQLQQSRDRMGIAYNKSRR